MDTTISYSLDAISESAKASAALKLERGRNLKINHIPMMGRKAALYLGSLGEEALVRYLCETNDSGYEILTPDDPAAFEEADVIANGWHLDVKTRTGKCSASPDWWVFVEAKSAMHDTDAFVFAWYNRVGRYVSLLGFLERDVLLSCAKRVVKGDALDNGWASPCDCYGIRIRELEPMHHLPVLLRECGLCGRDGNIAAGVRVL